MEAAARPFIRRLEVPTTMLMPSRAYLLLCHYMFCKLMFVFQWDQVFFLGRVEGHW